jgi:hypothetical protein
MEKIEKLKKLSEKIERYENNNFKIFLYVPNIPDNVYSMAVEEIFKLCYFFRKNNLDCYIIVEDTKETPYKIPEYLSDELKSQPILSPVKDKIEVEPIDFLIVPEFFVNVMHQINENKIPCERIVLCQSASYMIDSLPPNIKWNMWGFNNVLTTSDELKEFILKNTKNSFNVETYQIGIPDYFKPSEIKKPVIMYYSRYETEIKRLSKLFFLKYPELSWVLFERVSGSEPYITRERLAEKMSEIPFLLWLDKDAGFGTLPVEAMKSGAVVVGLVPDLEKEYTKSENTAIWSNSLDILAEQLGILVKTWLVDEIPTDVYENMKNISMKYSTDEHEKTSVQALLNIRDKKINGMKEVYKKIENE